MGPVPPQGWRAENLARWDELARLHPTTGLYDVSGVVAGDGGLRPWEDEELGPVAGRDVVHLQCHIGTDTIALARRGANVVGLDFAPAAVAAGRDLAARCGLTVEFVEGDVYHAAALLAPRTFDVVYTGVGAIGWLPDLRPWADTIASLLRPDGFLYLVEFHPMWVAHIGDGRTVKQPAINAPFLRWDAKGSYADPEAALTHTATWERLHALGDVLGAVLDAGLTIELFHEFDRSVCPTPWLEQHDDGLWHFPPELHPFPLMYSLRARK